MRKIISLSIGISFLVLLVTGILSYFWDYLRIVATIHTIFGILFSLGVLFHLKNNFRMIRQYLKGKYIYMVLAIGSLLLISTFYEVYPIKSLMEYGAKSKASQEHEVNLLEYELIQYNTDKPLKLTIDLLRGLHYWHPQMAIWIEDEDHQYLETLFVTKATASGLFYGGRSKTNFKDFDVNKNTSGSYRRVNALPVWSHKRNVQYTDGLYVPTYDNALPDAITGATITDNFKLRTSLVERHRFRLKIEINVAFDDNEYYSEYDFPEDDVFHNGTGQLGQPSIIFDVLINMNDDKHYYLMDLIGHGHHSAKNGTIYSDLSSLTTAKQIVERIVVGISEGEF